MSRNKQRSVPISAQASPTQPRPVDAQGYVLDAWGLPLNGPARLRRLAELGLPDPNEEPGEWAERGAHSWAPTEEIVQPDIPVTEDSNG